MGQEAVGDRTWLKLYMIAAATKWTVMATICRLSRQLSSIWALVGDVGLLKDRGG